MASVPRWCLALRLSFRWRLEAGRLRHAPEAVQRAVLGQGSLATCRDPNAGCVGRMRKAENCLMPSWSPPSRDATWRWAPRVSELRRWKASSRRTS